MKNIYPTEESMRALTAFQIFMGNRKDMSIEKIQRVKKISLGIAPVRE